MHGLDLVPLKVGCASLVQLASQSFGWWEWSWRGHSGGAVLSALVRVNEVATHMQDRNRGKLDGAIEWSLCRLVKGDDRVHLYTIITSDVTACEIPRLSDWRAWALRSRSNCDWSRSPWSLAIIDRDCTKVRWKCLWEVLLPVQAQARYLLRNCWCDAGRVGCTWGELGDLAWPQPGMTEQKVGWRIPKDLVRQGCLCLCWYILLANYLCVWPFFLNVTLHVWSQEWGWWSWPLAAMAN